MLKCMFHSTEERPTSALSDRSVSSIGLHHHSVKMLILTVSTFENISTVCLNKLKNLLSLTEERPTSARSDRSAASSRASQMSKKSGAGTPATRDGKSSQGGDKSKTHSRTSSKGKCFVYIYGRVGYVGSIGKKTWCLSPTAQRLGYVF